ncbi:unnamed protein product [Durusdinium trenchii]|uniref:Uncharacterized protein n=1 Tax=Durusdinium trenchii TaxID=1381693 RepID=A0ABP0JGK3_9DINO
MLQRCWLFCVLAWAQHQTPDDLTEEVRQAKGEVCEQWLLNQNSWSYTWRNLRSEARRAQLLDSVPLMPKAKSYPRAVTGEDAEGFADLCPELNLEELTSDPEVLLGLLEARCSENMADQRQIQDADLALARELARSGKIGKRSASSRKLFYLRDPITTDVTGPLQGQGAGESDWKSGASDLVIESEIWWTVLFRQQSIFMTLTSLLKDHFLGKEHAAVDVEEDDSIGFLIPGDVAFWSCGILVAMFFWALARLVRRFFLA